MAKITKEDWKDYAEMGKKILTFGSAFLFIAVIGSSIKASGWCIPIGTLAVAGLTWLGSKESTLKDRIVQTAVWGGMTALFTTVAVIAS